MNKKVYYLLLIDCNNYNIKIVQSFIEYAEKFILYTWIE